MDPNSGKIYRPDSEEMRGEMKQRRAWAVQQRRKERAGG